MFSESASLTPMTTSSNSVNFVPQGTMQTVSCTPLVPSWQRKTRAVDTSSKPRVQNVPPGFASRDQAAGITLEQQYHALIRGEARGLGPMLLRGGLRALSVPYGLAAQVRNRLYDWGWLACRRAGVPVISVGNLTLGGTGKTPCVEYVARFFRKHDLRVAILSRGYGGRDGRNDEALVLEENLPDVPHLQGPDRARLAETAVAELESEVLILDDGFQHRRLRRDLDLVLIDATNPWGHGRLFPAGLLREPPASLKRASAVLLTRCDLVNREERNKLEKRVKRLAPNALVAQTRHRPTCWINSQRAQRKLEEMTARPAAAFCGIGNPDAFQRTLANLGLNAVAFRVFPDHRDYTRDDVEDLRSWARSQPENAVILTTQKDLVKVRLDRLGDRELWALRIELEVETGREALEEMLADCGQALNRTRH